MIKEEKKTLPLNHLQIHPHQVNHILIQNQRKNHKIQNYQKVFLFKMTKYILKQKKNKINKKIIKNKRL
jgi:hypothetical protein